MAKLDNKISRMTCDLNAIAGTNRVPVYFVYIVIGCVGVADLDYADVHNVYV